MMNRLLALGLALVPGLAFAEVNTCSLTNNTDLQKSVSGKVIDSAFQANGNQIKALVTLNGSSGRFERQGVSGADRLPCIRYFTEGELTDLANNLSADGLRATDYFGNGVCQIVILADWTAGNSRGRAMWCAPFYSSGAEIQGIYWQDTDWTESKFTDLWNGRWK